MFKPLKEFTPTEAATVLCKKHYPKGCKTCPAFIEYGHSTKSMCYFTAKLSLLRNADKEADDGSVPDKDLPYWFN